MAREEGRNWHYVKPNESARIPRRHIFLDTEAVQEPVPGGEVQTWRLAVACFYSALAGRKVKERWGRYATPRKLWIDVDTHCGSHDRTVLWAHNLSYDVRISDAFAILPQLGWRLEAHNINPRGTWLTWRKGRATLMMVDSMSVFPASLERVGQCFDLAKVDLPAAADPDDEWLARCLQDVNILRTAVLAYLTWLEDNDMGNWQPTGAGQSWAVYRHKFLTHKLLVHNDEDALRAERRALWTGRCEAYWHGELRGQVVHEWDFEMAYARIARDNPVPVRLIGPMPDDYDWQSICNSDSAALLAEVTVTTDLPVVPCESAGRVLWPVGTFDTTLWDVEIVAAMATGARVTIRRGWLYRKRYALKSWAEWIIGELGATDPEPPVWLKLIYKHWSRALIGRMAMTYGKWEEYATAPESATSRFTVYDTATGETSDMLQVGHTIWQHVGTVESPNSLPMITGYVQAIARVRLWNVMRALPDHALLYVDTDSLLVTDKHFRAVEAIAATPMGEGLRLKRSWQGFAIYGPRQIRTGEQLRVAGIPHRAERQDDGTYAGEVWDTLATALKRGGGSKVIVRDRVWHVSGVDRRRDAHGIGWTTPIAVPQPV
jgi:hypothetical protein